MDLPRPDYSKTLAQILGDFTISLMQTSRSLAPLYCFQKCLGVSGYPSWVLEWKDCELDIVRSWGVENKEPRVFRDDYCVSSWEGRLRLEGRLCGSIRQFGSPVPAVQGYYSSRSKRLDPKVELLEWFRGALSTTQGYDDCPNGLPAWEALSKAWFRNNQLDSRSTTLLMATILILLQSGLVTSHLKRHTDLVRLAPSPAPEMLKMLDRDELLGRIVHDATIARFADNLTAAAEYYVDGKLFQTSRGWIGVSTAGFEDKDILALLHGSSVPAILRPVDEYFRLVGFASVEGMPDDVWPVRGDEEGVQSITLV